MARPTVQELLEKQRRFQEAQKKVAEAKKARDVQAVQEMFSKMKAARKPLGEDEEMPDVPQGKGTQRSSQPMMFGEGLGNHLGLEGPKYDTGWKTAAQREAEEKAEAEWEAGKAERRRQGAEKAKVSREKNRLRAQRLQEKVTSGVLMSGKRCFLVEWPREDFEERAQAAGYEIPSEVDVAKTDFGFLLLIPVVEAEQAKQEGFTGNGIRDLDGRTFFVRNQVREVVEFAFGRVTWRPLSETEMKQFGVQVQ